MELSNETRREMFWTMLLSRRLDETAWALHREKKITYHISGIGHETDFTLTELEIENILHDFSYPIYWDPLSIFEIHNREHCSDANPAV